MRHLFKEPKFKKFNHDFAHSINKSLAISSHAINQSNKNVDKKFDKAINSVFSKNTFAKAGDVGKYVVGSGTSVITDVTHSFTKVADHAVSNPMLYIALAGVALIMISRR
jgi:hypothetical protein